jgi:hypothetical protein
LAGLVSSYIFLYFTAPFYFHSLVYLGIALALFPLAIKIFINRLSWADIMTVGLGAGFYFTFVLLILPSGVVVTKIVRTDLREEGGHLLHLDRYSSDEDVLRALMWFRLGHAMLLLMFAAAVVLQLHSARHGMVTVSKKLD